MVESGTPNGSTACSIPPRRAAAPAAAAGTVGTRELLAVVTVNTPSDVADGVTSSIAALLSSPGADGVISLREAIQAANNTAHTGAPDEIRFALPGVGTHTIQPTSALPTITNPVVIDATSQTGYAGQPLVELDGTNAGSANGLYINDLNVWGPRNLTAAVPPAGTPPPYLDPTGDNWIGAVDALTVINHINEHGPGPIPAAVGGEGESVPVVDVYPVFGLSPMG